MGEGERAALRAELDDLRRKLRKRQDQCGYAGNAESVRQRIAVIEAVLAAAGT